MEQTEAIVRRELTPFQIVEEAQREVTGQVIDNSGRQELGTIIQHNEEDTQGQETKEQTSESTVEKNEPDNNVVSDPPLEESDPKEGKETPQEVDVKLEGNIARYAAEVLRQNGGLPDDFEISDDITEEDLDRAYVSFKEESLRAQIRQEEVNRLREEEGLTEPMIEEIKNKYYGVQDEEQNKLQSLSYLSNYKFDDKADDYESTAAAFLNDFYTMKGLSPKRIDSFVANDLKDNDLPNIISEYQTQLSSQAQELKTTIATKREENRNKMLQKKQEREEQRQDILKKGVIDNVKYTPQEMEAVRKALYDKTEIITDEKGNRYKVTAYYKAVLESKRDVEKDLAHKVQVILGRSRKVSEAKQQGREEGTKKTISKLNNYIKAEVQLPKETKKGKDEPTRQNISTIQRRALN